MDMDLNHVVLGLACAGLVAASVNSQAAEASKADNGAKDPQEARTFSKRIVKNVKGNYLLYLPEGYEKDTKKRWPLVMFLHGIGERGDDVSRVKSIGPPAMVAEGKQFPFIMVSPQCPPDSWWGSETDVLTALLDEIEAKYRVDKNRVYLTGLSMGGYGTWALAAAQPKRFAAIAPICGGGDPKRAYLIKDIPMWVFHGDKDSVVPLAQSQDMVNAVKAAGGKPKFTVYPGVEHDSWTVTYNNDEFWKWLLEQIRK